MQVDFWTAGKDARDFQQFIWLESGDDLDPGFIKLKFDPFPRNETCLIYRSMTTNSHLTNGACESQLKPLCMRLSAKLLSNFSNTFYLHINSLPGNVQRYRHHYNIFHYLHVCFTFAELPKND